MHRRRSSLVRGVLCVVAAAAACSSGGDSASERRSGRPAPTAADAAGACGRVPEPREAEGPSAETVLLQGPDDGGPAVEGAVYPRPDYRGDPWSQWGQGVALADGRFVSAIGDHLGPDGNSYLFVYEPERERITRFADVLSHAEHEAGDWGYGKVHGQMLAGPCGEVFFGTYYGDLDGLEYGGTYRGDLLFRVDPSTLEVERLGVPVPERGLPSLAGPTPDGILYGEAVDPLPADPDAYPGGAFFAYDPARDRILFRSDDERHSGFRNILVDGEGTAYLATDDSRLLVYEPGSTELRVHPERLPGGWLRASTLPAPDGTVYGVTNEPFNLFALRPDGSIRDLGPAGGYTASLALHPDGRRFFFVPGAHGDSWQKGTPLVAVDTDTGEQEVVVELNQLAERELNLTLGGTYNVAVDPSGERVYVGFNAGPDRDDPWGQVVLVVVHLR